MPPLIWFGQYPNGRPIPGQQLNTSRPSNSGGGIIFTEDKQIEAMMSGKHRMRSETYILPFLSCIIPYTAKGCLQTKVENF